MQLPPFFRRRLTVAFLAYLVLLALSHLWRPLSSSPSLVPQQKHLQLAPNLTIAYTDRGRQPTKQAAPILLLHGSPVARSMFSSLLPHLEQRTRVITPDLPGYDASPAPDGDYSNLAYARRILQLANHLKLEAFHLVGYSQGGGVALHLADIAPQQVRSLTLLSAIGVQELELLGDYRLNRGVHAIQLGLLWLLHQATPHLGLLDRFPLNLTYARHFYESDQRPLRGVLSKFEAPLLILHGRNDALVPVAAAREHHRLVPQSRLHLYDSGHGLILGHGAQLAVEIADFVDQVSRGQALSRAQADPIRTQQAQVPFSSIQTEPLPFLGVAVLLGIIALSTLVSEDLACIGAGLLAARGTVDFLPATLACLVGIFVGDMLLYAAGRFLGRSWLKRPPLKWLVRPQSGRTGRPLVRRRRGQGDPADPFCTRH